MSLHCKERIFFKLSIFVHQRIWTNRYERSSSLNTGYTQKPFSPPPLIERRILSEMFRFDFKETFRRHRRHLLLIFNVIIFNFIKCFRRRIIKDVQFVMKSISVIKRIPFPHQHFILLSEKTTLRRKNSFIKICKS